MKTFSAACLLVFITLYVVFSVAQVSANNYNAELKLADDASTPEKKSEYLGDYIKRLESDHSIPEYAAYIWKNPRNKISNQIDVLKSLKQRCDDIAPLNKESMGYSQGMTQITGQEFDHALDNCGEIVAKGYLMGHWGWFIMYQFSWSWILLVPPPIVWIKYLMEN